MSAIHDHFDGEAHCRQCGGGPCQLQGAELALCRIVRAVFVDIARNGLAENLYLRGTLEDAGVPFDQFLQRAREKSASLEEYAG